MPTKNSRMHGSHNALWPALGWAGHWGKEVRRRRKANKRAKQARKRNRD